MRTRIVITDQKPFFSFPSTQSTYIICLTPFLFAARRLTVETDAPTSTSDGKHTSKGKATSSPVPHTLTQTLQDGQVTVMTSTSWVDVTPASGTPDSSNNPDLQNTGVKSLVSTLAVLGAAFMGGMLLV